MLPRAHRVAEDAVVRAATSQIIMDILHHLAQEVHHRDILDQETLGTELLEAGEHPDRRKVRLCRFNISKALVLK